MTGTTIQPDRILKELHALWADLDTEAENTVLRACAMTLFVLTEAGEDPEPLSETLAALMPQHPSRAVIIRVRLGAYRELSSRVYAQCWMPFGVRRHVCCEQIEIDASDAALADLPAPLLALTAPDLPVTLWCRSARLLERPEFASIARLAQKVIVDSDGFPSASQAFSVLLSQMSEAHAAIADLAWTRLTPWRQVIAQVFDQTAYLVELPRISAVRARFAGAGPPVSAFYLAAWLAAAIRRAGGRPVIEFPRESANTAGLLGFEANAPGLALAFDPTIAELVVNGCRTRVACHPPPEHEALREELNITGLDRVFVETLPYAAELAASSIDPR